MTDDDSTTRRRRFLALLAALFAALFGAGFGTSQTFESPPPEDDDGFDLSVDFSIDRENPPRQTPTPTPTGGSVESPNRSNADHASSNSPTDGHTPSHSSDDDEAPSDGPPSDEFPSARGLTPSGESASTPTSTPKAASSSLLSATQPLTLSNLHPGDSGTLTATVSVSGESARLWARGDVTGIDERLLTEPELIAGDDGVTGELQSYVDLTLWYDDGGTTVTVYEGPITELPSAWTSLADSCFEPGAYTLYLDWVIDPDAPNAIQTDSVTFSFGVAASSCPV